MKALLESLAFTFPGDNHRGGLILIGYIQIPKVYSMHGSQNSTLVLLFGLLLALKLTRVPSPVVNDTGLLVLVFFLLAKKDGIDL